MPILAIEFETEEEVVACKAYLSVVLKALEKASVINDTKLLKKKKDPNAPKKNLNSYMLYTREVRQDVANANPTLKVNEVAKIVGGQWRKLSEEAKKKYVDLASEDKVRYDKELKAYQNPTSSGESTDESASSSEEEVTHDDLKLKTLCYDNVDYTVNTENKEVMNSDHEIVGTYDDDAKKVKFKKGFKAKHQAKA